MTRRLAFILLLAACSDAKPENTPTDSGTSGSDAAQPVCEPGADQTCNDNPAISSLHGTCLPNGTCECAEGIEKNAATGRCR
jgi:hypothetical protein